MDGKTVLITGANRWVLIKFFKNYWILFEYSSISGIGKETARDLAKRGARVIMACRTMETAIKARGESFKNFLLTCC